MKPGTLALISVAGLGLLGYAAYTVMSEPGRTRAARPVAGEDGKRDGAAGAERTRGKGGIKRVEPTTKGDARQPIRGGPPQKVVPKVTLDQARKDFDTLIAEYDRLIDDETTLDNERWTRLYAKGAAALVPLQQHLSSSVPDQAEELRAAQETYREKIDALQRQVVTPGVPPAKTAPPPAGR